MLGRYRVAGVFLATGSTDLRKSINGLSIIVQETFGLDPFNHCLYVFCNRSRDKLKILHWEDSGFWLYYKRLEKSVFKWPAKNDTNGSFQVTERELNWLLDGLQIEQQKAHKPVLERLII